MRNIKPVTLVRLAVRPSKVVLDIDCRCRRRDSTSPYLVTNALAFVSPRRRSQKPTSSNRECVAWNGQSVTLSIRGVCTQTLGHCSFGDQYRGCGVGRCQPILSHAHSNTSYFSVVC